MPQEAKARAQKYAAFISYSHKDKKWGDWLHKALESYRVPKRLAGTQGRNGKIPPRVFPVFRDREELPSSADLNEQIVAALDASEYLIVICSPRAVTSRWVNEEILAFKRKGRENRILALVVDGVPNADDEPALEDLQKPGFAAAFGVARDYPRECFPSALKFKLDEEGNLGTRRNEPIAADVRAEGDGKENARLKLLAGLLGVGYDVLRQREHEAQRRRMRRAAALSGAIALSLTALLVLSLFALVDSETTRNSALIAQSQFLARDADTATTSGDAGLGMMLALQALPEKISAPSRPLKREALAALSHAWRDMHEIGQINVGEPLVGGGYLTDSRIVVTGSAKGTVTVWDIVHGQRILAMAHPGAKILSVAPSSDGKRIVAVYDDKSVCIWDTATGRKLSVITGFLVNASYASFSPDDKWIAISSWDEATIRNAATGKVLVVLRGHDGQIKSVVFSPDGTRVVTASSDATARVWDARSGQQIAVLRGHDEGLTFADFSPDGGSIVTASWDHSARTWDARTGKARVVMRGHEAEVVSARFSSDGRQIVTASRDTTARIWTASTGIALLVLRGHTGGVSSAEWSADGTRVITASDDGTVRIWSDPGVFVTGEKINFAGWSADGRRVATASMDGTAQIWDARTGKVIRVLGSQGVMINTALFSSDGARVVTTGFDSSLAGSVRVWDAATGRQLLSYPGGYFGSAVFSADGTTIAATRTDNTIVVFDAATGRTALTLKTGNAAATFTAISPNGRHIAGASTDGNIRIWDRSSGQLLKVLRGHLGRVNGVAYSPDSRRLASAGEDETARIWDAATGTQISILHQTAQVYRAAFSPDGTRVVTASGDKTATVWDVATGKKLDILRGHVDVVSSAAFAVDNDHILTASWDGTFRKWDPIPRCQTLIDASRRRIARSGRALTSSERSQYFLTGTPVLRFSQWFEPIKPLYRWMVPAMGDTCQ
ncbi:TIR domain-containing protein [Rhizomicrobium electricum]|uniref:TIR domain-containing protein n=1 Tax=Rhizomicrobium electricum TaxID=480070 RepID=A0ABN1F7A1_9PROT|nr:TIR domain-containing protein [Rhizomicrobium electricum]NIJ50421.1 WD40 repeat protein [Rhizomicrobium electricum]